MVDAMTPPASVLETARFGLRPLAETDRCDLFAHLADPATVERMDIEPLSDLAGADAIIAWAVRLLAAGQGVRWAIRDHAGGFVGTVGFNALIRERASRGELAYDVVRARWRQGVMAEVMPATLSYGYDELGLRRIEALVTPREHGISGAPGAVSLQPRGDAPRLRLLEGPFLGPVALRAVGRRLACCRRRRSSAAARIGRRYRHGRQALAGRTEDRLPFLKVPLCNAVPIPPLEVALRA